MSTYSTWKNGIYSQFTNVHMGKGRPQMEESEKGFASVDGLCVLLSEFQHQYKFHLRWDHNKTDF
jgi:hypothetical protein